MAWSQPEIRQKSIGGAATPAAARIANNMTARCFIGFNCTPSPVRQQDGRATDPMIGLPIADRVRQTRSKG